MESTITLTRHTVEEQKKFPQATGAFTALFWNLTIAFKRISAVVNKAGLADALGLTGSQNVHGEEVQKLDEYAHQSLVRAMAHGGHLCVMASEEKPELIPIPEGYERGNYVLLFDPLDGSSNIDANVSVGTIFCVYRRVSESGDGTLADCLQPGVRQVAAGYVIYGSSTMLVYTTGRGVHGFTLDPSIGEFLLSHADIRIPEAGKIYSVNEGNYGVWDAPTRAYIDHLKQAEAPGGALYSLRYIGSLVADFHRNLLYGGVFLYPASHGANGRALPKLRLLYEANPLAFICEQAGGRASTGRARILEMAPAKLHQKVPLAIGSRKDVEAYEKFVAGEER